jgi:PTS system cellobiose-specific IIC component
MKLSEKFEENMSIIASKIDGNKYLMVIKSSFTQLLPFIMIGSFGTLFDTLISNPNTGLAKWIPVLETLKPAFSALSFACVTCMAVYLIFLIGFHMGKQNGVPEHISGVLSLASYVTVVPNIVNVKIQDVIGSTAGLSSTVLGAQGLIIGMIVGVVSIEIFSMLMKFDKLKIKMPDTVPPMIATSFNTLLPLTLTLVIVSIGGVLFKTFTGVYLNEFIYSIIQSPLEAIFQTPIGLVVIIFVMQLFWFLGIHGGAATNPIKNPMMAAAIAANIASVSAGEVPDQSVTLGFWRCFVALGGGGMVISLVIAIFIVGKRKENRSIAKLGLLPAICGISEPMVFGYPLVLNITLAIPFILASCISAVIALSAFNLGFLASNTFDVPFGIPILLNALIQYGWKGVIVQIICIVVTTLMYVPFVAMHERQLAKQDK